MTILSRVLSPLLGLAVAAIGMLVALEVARAWVRPAGGPLTLPWPQWQATLQGWTWTSTPVRLFAAGLFAAGLLLLVLALRAGSRAVQLINLAPEITVTTSPRSLARLVGSQGRDPDNVSTARPAGAQCTLIGLTGLLLLAAGAVILVVGTGLLGANRAARPVLDPLVEGTLATHQTLTRIVAIATGVALLVAGLLWVTRSLKPEHHPDLLLDSSPDRRLVVSAAAIGGALRADAETITGVNRARARMAGTTATPIVRLDLWLDDAADVRDIYRDLDTRVLSRARDSLGVASLPAAIHIEFVTAAPARVS